MAVFLSPVGGVAAQFFTNTGAVLTGGKLYTYAAGTTTPATTYTSSNGLAAWTNPIVLDAAGRVSGSGEIWLTDGINYKFVLKDSNDVLIATYDNVSGINSNFVAFTNSQEIQTATANQTVFTLTTMSYQAGTNSLSVFVDGVNQYGPGAQYAYTETSSTSVTFVNGLHVGALVKFTTSQQQGASSVDAEQVSYTPPFTNSVTTNVEAKLAQYVSVKDFGAVGDGTTDDTAAFNLATQASAAYSDTVARRGIFVPAGKYRIDGTVYVRKGQAFYGLGGYASHLYLGSTGSVHVGEDSSGTEDPGGRPPAVYDLFFEGGAPAVKFVGNGWSANNLFISSAVTGLSASGSDGIISGCTFDDGSSLLILDGFNHIVNGCNFYLGNNQVRVTTGLANTTITNCLFNYPKVNSFQFGDAPTVVNVRELNITNCAFSSNVQYTTQTAYFETTSLSSVHAYLDSCSFTNGYAYAIKLTGGTEHNLEITDCVFDGEKVLAAYAQSTTFKGIIYSTSEGRVTMSSCTFKNMPGQPVEVSGIDNMAFIMTDSYFSDNTGGTSDIIFSNTFSTSTFILRDIIGSGRQLYSFGAGIFGTINFQSSGLQNWYAYKTNGVKDYVEIPYIGSAMFDIGFIANPTNGGASTLYRKASQYISSITYDANPSAVTLCQLTQVFTSTSTSGLTLTLNIDIDTVGGGTSKAGHDTQGLLVYSWDTVYDSALINVQPSTTMRVT
jgi:hypothetical protein